MKQDFVKRGGGGTNQNFPHKDGGWSKRGELKRFRILREGGQKEEGDFFMGGGFIPWCTL